MLRLFMLIAVFVLMMITNLQRAHATETEMNLTLCSKWVDSAATTTFTCSKNGKTYATGLSFCTVEKSQSTIEEMISDIKVTRLFCKPEWSVSAFECSKDEDAETAACADEFQASSMASTSSVSSTASN